MDNVGDADANDWLGIDGCFCSSGYFDILLVYGRARVVFFM